MNNVVTFPGTGTWEYNAQRLHRYADSMYDKGRIAEFEIVMTISQLYDEDLIEIGWCPRTGDPIAISKKEEGKDNA